MRQPVPLMYLIIGDLCDTPLCLSSYRTPEIQGSQCGCATNLIC